MVTSCKPSRGRGTSTAQSTHLLLVEPLISPPSGLRYATDPTPCGSDAFPRTVTGKAGPGPSTGSGWWIVKVGGLSSTTTETSAFAVPLPTWTWNFADTWEVILIVSLPVAGSVPEKDQLSQKD